MGTRVNSLAWNMVMKWYEELGVKIEKKKEWR